MPSFKNIRFQKLDKFNNAVFIVNSKKEPKAFVKLCKMHTQLEEKNYETFLPIYSDLEKSYATIRFKKNITFEKLNKNDVCDVKYEIKQRKHENKTYVTCYIRQLKLVKKAEPEDLGENVAFDSESDQSESDQSE